MAIRQASTKQINSLYSNNKKHVPFKCLFILYKIFHIFLGLDFGFMKFKSSKKNIIAKLFVVFQIIFLCGTYLGLNAINRKYMDIKLLCYMVQYIAYVLILTCIKTKNTFCSIMQDLRIIDIGLQVLHESYNLELKLFSFLLGSFVYRVVITTVFCFRYGFTPESFEYIVLLYSLDVIRITYAFTFYAITCRLKQLGKLLERTNSNFLSVQYLYKSIVDIAEQHKNAFDPVFIIALMFNIPHAMYSMFIAVKYYQDKIAADYLIIVEMLLYTIIPANFAGMLSSQAHNIKVNLHDLLLQPRDDEQFDEIKQFIQYVEARDCRFHVCKVIPLNADLLGMVLNFYVTYLIVVMQFGL